MGYCLVGIIVIMMHFTTPDLDSVVARNNNYSYEQCIIDNGSYNFAEHTCLCDGVPCTKYRMHVYTWNMRKVDGYKYVDVTYNG
jgi:hypothetical protein